MSSEATPAREPQPDTLEELAATLTAVCRRLDDLEADVAGMRRRLRKDRRRITTTAEDIERLAPQVASIEARLESLRQSRDGAVDGTADEVTAARNVVDEVRREHERIRIRFTGMAAYEARLARLEKLAAQDEAPRTEKRLRGQLRKPRRR